MEHAAAPRPPARRRLPAPARPLHPLLAPALALALALMLARPAAAQSWYLDWLKRIEEWSLKEDYRGWVFHGVIAAAVTLAADRLADRAAYGAALASGFYLGKELREAAIWDGFTTDRIMDMTTPVAAAIAAAILLRDTPPRAGPPRVLPPALPAPCDPPPARAAPPSVRRPGPLRAPTRPWLCLADAAARAGPAAGDGDAAGPPARAALALAHRR